LRTARSWPKKRRKLSFLELKCIERRANEDNPSRISKESPGYRTELPRKREGESCIAPRVDRYIKGNELHLTYFEKRSEDRWGINKKYSWRE